MELLGQAAASAVAVVMRRAITEVTEMCLAAKGIITSVHCAPCGKRRVEVRAQVVMKLRSMDTSMCCRCCEY